MKNVLLAITVLSFLWIGCGKKESDKAPVSAKSDSSGVLQTTKDDAPPKDVSLNYELKKDQHLSYRVTAISSQNQSLVTDTTIRQNVKQTITYLIDMDVKDIENDKTMDIKLNVKSIKMDAEANGQKVSYESGLLKDQTERQKYVEYESLLNNPFSFRISPKGEILEVYRVDKIVDKFLELRGIKDSVTGDQKRQFQQSMSEGALKPLIQQIFRALPKNQITVDSTWQYSYPTRITVFDVENINKYKLQGFEKLNNDRLAIINASLEMKSKGKNKYTERGVDYDFKSPEAEGNGKIYFNMAKGCIQQSKTSSKVKLNTTIKAPKTPKGPMKAVRNDVIESTNIIELL